MEQAIQKAPSKDIKELMPAVEHLHRLLQASRKASEVTSLVVCCSDLLKYNNFMEVLEEEKLKEFIHRLEQESGFFFSMELSKYGDTKTARIIMLIELKKLIEANPLFREKLAFPGLRSSRLPTQITQSLHWQHQLCKSPRLNPDIKTLFSDYFCASANGALASSSVSLPAAAAVLKPTLNTSLGAHAPFPPAAAMANANALAGWMSNAATLGMLEYHNADHEQNAATCGDVKDTAKNHVLAVGEDKKIKFSDNTNVLTRLPRCPQLRFSKVMTPFMPPPSASTFLSFHPQTLITQSLNWQHQLCKNPRLNPNIKTLFSDHFCASANGALASSSVSLPAAAAVLKPTLNTSLGAHAPFSPAAAMANANALAGWMPNAATLGMLEYLNADHEQLMTRLRPTQSIGQVNNLTFVHPNKQLSVVTCGDDKLIKVWDMNGRKLFTFEGHEAPVYSTCPHQKEDIQFIFSTAVDGKIKDTAKNHFLAVGEDNKIKFSDNTNVLTRLPSLRFSKVLRALIGLLLISAAGADLGAPEAVLTVPDNRTAFEKLQQSLPLPVLIVIIIAVFAIFIAVGAGIAYALRATQQAGPEVQEAEPDQAPGQVQLGLYHIPDVGEAPGPVRLGLYHIPDVVEVPIIVHGPEGTVVYAVPVPQPPQA